MRIWTFWILLCGLALARPANQRLRLSEGLRGGFAPTPPTFEMLVVPAAQGAGYDLYYKLLKGAKYQAFRTSLMDLRVVEADLDRLGLFRLPQAAANELDDIYRSETALEVSTARHQWKHQPPVGCVRGQAKVQPDASQIQTFRAAAGRLKQLAQGGRSCPVEEMTRAEVDSRK